MTGIRPLMCKLKTCASPVGVVFSMASKLLRRANIRIQAKQWEKL